jgi:hemerythrin superfamily protein
MPNAIALLREDHQKVKDLFRRFEGAESGEKKEIVATTLQELAIHTTLEEEVFYPAARKVLEETGEETDLIDEAWEEHHVVKLLAAELKKMRASDDRYDAKFTVLAESVKHHIEEEEGELFPKLEGHLNGENIGEKMTARKEKLQKRPVSSANNRNSRSTASKRSRGRSGKGRRQAGRRRRA